MSRAQLLHVVQWAALECEKQQSGERSVGWMVEGWDYAMRRRTRPPREHDIKMLGLLVEPRLAANGYREVNVRVGHDVKGPWQDVPRQMTQLVGALTDPEAQISPAEWYRQYEEVHPFRDGNGRTGSILHAWLAGNLERPQAPPDFWPEPDMMSLLQAEDGILHRPRWKE